MISIVTYATAPLRGKVSTQASRMLEATPQRTALTRLLAPTPMMQALMQWVVETGIPSLLAARITRVPEVSAAKPWSGAMRMILVPMVLMMRLPPAIVPRPMAAAQMMITQRGTSEPVGVIHCGRPP